MEFTSLEKIESMLCKIKGKVLGVAKYTKKVAQDDPRRITHCLKVGLAITLVSFIYYFRPLYDSFGRHSAIWAVMTVIVVFEFSVGAVLSKSINRGIATLSAGALGIGATYLANLLGERGESIVLVVSVFVLATTMTFVRFIPRLKAKYDYGMQIFIYTFCFVTISGKRVDDEILALARHRVTTILMGGASCVVISIFIFPVWAGEDLQNLLATNLENLALFLEGFGGDFCNSDQSTIKSYKMVLNTKTSEESLANLGWWEPGHGNFGFGHPYELYLKIGVLIRKCGYNVEILSNYLNTNLRIPKQLEDKLRPPCLKISSESSKAIREIVSSFKTMSDPSSPCIPLQNSKIALEHLKLVLQTWLLSENINLSDIMPTLTAVSILGDTVKCIEDIHDAVSELSRKAHLKREKKAAIVSRIVDHDEDCIAISIREISSELPEGTLPPSS